jgi:ribosomal protein S18 acetylase RimI-like enzyme
MHALEFRRATVDDAALLARMNQQLIRDEGHRNPMSLAELQARMAGWLAGEYEAFLFLQAGTAAGYVLFRREPQWIYVRQLFVVPEQRRRGIARSALAWLRANVWQNAPRLRMEVLVQNTAAIAFWHSAGFQDYALTMELDQNGG